MQSLQQSLADRLEARRQASAYRQRLTLDSPQHTRVRIDNEQLLSFCSNDYLALANDPQVIDSFRQAAADFGVGSGGSHLVSGHSHHHHALEEELAAFTGRSRVLTFSSGYMANVGILTALAGKGDRIFEDRLNHASLLDGGLFSGARFRRYAHNDVDALERQLAGGGQGRAFVVTDGVFSMDGDVAPLDRLIDLAARHDAVLMMDDAHGFGCLGAGGTGLAGTLPAGRATEDTLPILVGTFGKAFGTAGAFVAGSEMLIEALIQFCRPYIYTTAMPPAIAAATRTSLQLLQTGHWRREKLQGLIARFRQGCHQLGFAMTDSDTPIQGLILGESAQALAFSAALRERGMLVTAIRPPTVPTGTARLRITFSAAHEAGDVDALLTALEAISTGQAAP